MDIAEFLAVQLDGDEKTATGLREMVRSLSEINDLRSPATRQGTHIYDAAAWALGRVLADVAAKRRILAHHIPETDLRIRDGKYVQDPPKCTICWLPYPDRGKRQRHPCTTLCLLAAPYAAHPDYDEAWRIDA